MRSLPEFLAITDGGSQCAASCPTRCIRDRWTKQEPPLGVAATGGALPRSRDGAGSVASSYVALFIVLFFCVLITLVGGGVSYLVGLMSYQPP